MWLENIKENKSAAIYWGYLAIIGVIFYLMNCYTPFRSDDWHYCFIYGTTEPIDSFSDIIKSQYIHYFQVNGRFIPHFIVQFFDGIAGKEWFNFFNAIVFFIFLHLLTKTINNKNENKIATLSIITLLIFFIIPGFKNCFLWMSGACNYLWSATFLLYFNSLLSKDTHKKYYPLLFIYGWICGWTHEGLVIGLLIGYFFYYIIYRNKIYTSNYYLLIGFIIGTFLLVFSPASINRALSHSAPIQEPWSLIKDYIVALLNMDNIRMLPLLLFLLYVTRKKIHLRQYLTNNIVWIAAIISLFLFVLFTKHASEHSRFGFELFALILITQIIFQLKLSNKIFHCINITVIITLSFYILPANIENYNEYTRITNIIKNYQNELIITKNKKYNKIHNRFNIYYTTEENSMTYSGFMKKSLRNIQISTFFNRKGIYFIPEYILNDILTDPSLFSYFYTNDNYPVYIKEINPTEKPIKVTFILNETDYSTLPFYIRAIYKRMDRYRLTNINTDKFSVIDLNDKSYLFVGKNYMIDSRVKDIIYE